MIAALLAGFILIWTASVSQVNQWTAIDAPKGDILVAAEGPFKGVIRAECEVQSPYNGVSAWLALEGRFQPQDGNEFYSATAILRPGIFAADASQCERVRFTAIAWTSGKAKLQFFRPVDAN